MSDTGKWLRYRYACCSIAGIPWSVWPTGYVYTAGFQDHDGEPREQRKDYLQTSGNAGQGNEGQQCATNNGETSACCGRQYDKGDEAAEYICPPSRLTCVGYNPGNSWGT